MTLWSLFIFSNVQNQGQQNMQAKLWIGSCFSPSCSAQPSKRDHPAAPSTVRSPRTQAVHCRCMILCGKGFAPRSLFSFQQPPFLQVTLTVHQTPYNQTAACSKRGSHWQHGGDPSQWHLCTNIISKTQVCVGQRCAREGQFSAENMWKCVSTCVCEDSQMCVFVYRHYLRELTLPAQGQHTFPRRTCFSWCFKT